MLYVEPKWPNLMLFWNWADAFSRYSKEHEYGYALPVRRRQAPDDWDGYFGPRVLQGSASTQVLNIFSPQREDYE